MSATVRPAGPLAWTLDVTLREAAPLSVSYGVPDEPVRLRMQSPPARTHSLLLARLRAGRTYRYQIEGSTYVATFQTDPLPADLADVAFNATGRTTAPLVLLHLFHADGFKGYAVVDHEGEIVWYWRSLGFPDGMTHRANGNFVLMDRARGLFEVTPSGAQVHTLAQDPDREMHHDVTATPWNSLLFIAFDARETAEGQLFGDAIWEWSPESDALVKRWSAWDHLSPDTDRGPRFAPEWLHANSLAVGPRGNVLVSVHYFNQVISIAPDWQSLEWRLGGVNATLPLTDAAQFSGQHTAREVAPDRVLLFDNRHERGGFSRAVEYSLTGGTATVAWEWRPARDNFAAVVSSARRLPNGNTLVGFGTAAGVAGASGPTEVFEVTPAGAEVWHLLVDGPSVMYRAEPLSTLAGEAEVTP